jgi:hypothetical protein
MATQQQDYILRHIETISRLVARLRRPGKLLGPEDMAELNETLLLALHLQEKNFGVPAAEFLRLSADEQIASLKRSESKLAGQERCLTYATLLRDTAELYAYRGNTDLALGARQLALHVALTVALDQAGGASTGRTMVHDLVVALEGAELPPPTRELLERLGPAPA